MKLYASAEATLAQHEVSEEWDGTPTGSVTVGRITLRGRFAVTLDDDTVESRDLDDVELEVVDTINVGRDSIRLEVATWAVVLEQLEGLRKAGLL